MEAIDQRVQLRAHYYSIIKLSLQKRMHQSLWLCYYAQSCALYLELLQNNGKESPVSGFMKFTAHEFQNQLQQNAPHVLNEYKVDWHSRSYDFWQTKADWFLLNQLSTIEQKLNYIHLNPMRVNGVW